MTFNEQNVNRDSDGKFGTKEGWPPDVALTSPDGFVSFYEYEGSVLSAPELRKKLGLDADADLNEAIQRQALERGVDLSQDFSSFDVPVHHLEKSYEMPTEDEGIDLDATELGMDEDRLHTPHARLTEDGKVGVSANYYENLLWNDDFTEEELDRAYPLVEGFFKERFGVEMNIPDNWNSIDLEFYAEFDKDEFSPSVVGTAFDSRSNFAKFVNESDPGTYGSPYAYNDLRKQIDAADFVEDRWATLDESKTIDASINASALPSGGRPTDAEAVAIARSLYAYGEWTGPGQEEVAHFAEHGWTKDTNSLRAGLTRTAEFTVNANLGNRASALVAWLDRNQDAE